MFYYYGRKKQIAHLYPPPLHDKIIEPFAGSAAYSLHGDNWQKEVTLIDSSRDCIAVWEFLLQATNSDIKNLPEPKEGDSLNDLKLSRAEQLLLSFHIHPGCVSMRNKVGRFNRWKAGKKYILENIHKIKHWKVIRGNYNSIENCRATWFVDPPYLKAGKHYTEQFKDYKQLAVWCQQLDGQVIVCEGDNHGNYLPFQPLNAHVNNGGMNKSYKNQEYVWYNYDNAGYQPSEGFG